MGGAIWYRWGAILVSAAPIGFVLGIACFYVWHAVTGG